MGNLLADGVAMHKTRVARELARVAARGLPRAHLTPRPRHYLPATEKRGTQGFSEMRERSMLSHVFRTAEEGNPESVASAMDVFWDDYYKGEGTAEWQLRVAALDSAITDKQPKLMMELGSYCGYSAVRAGQKLPAGGKLISIEIDPLYASIARTVVEHAGLQDRVSVRIGSLAELLASGELQRKHGLDGPLDALLLDHDVNSYLSDLQLLEGAGHIGKETVVLCDWSLYPGSKEAEASEAAPRDPAAFMDYLSGLGLSASTKNSLRDKEVFSVSSAQWGQWQV